MSNIEYGEAAVEVLDILNHTEKEAIKKIPESFMKFLIEISNKSYQAKFNHEYPIDGFNLRVETRQLLGFIYITWWCDDSERIKYKNLIHDGEINKQKIENKFNNDIFKNKKENKYKKEIQEISENCKSIAVYKEENLLKKIINKILNFIKGEKI